MAILATVSAADADYVARFLEGFMDYTEADTRALRLIADALYALGNDTDAIVTQEVRAINGLETCKKS